MSFDPINTLDSAQLIYMHNSDMGQIRVVESKLYRGLFINDTLHSVMSLTSPARLVLPHQHAMAMALFYKPLPKKILELGLGGGSIARYIYHHMQTRISSIEHDQSIINCFEQYFNPDAVPVDLQHADAELKIKEQSDCDLLFLDIFGQYDNPPFLSDFDFYHHCIQALSAEGLMVINLLALGELHLAIVEDILIKLTGHRPMCLVVPGYKNKILLVSKNKLDNPEFDQRLLDFVAAFNIDLNSFIKM